MFKCISLYSDSLSCQTQITFSFGEHPVAEVSCFGNKMIRLNNHIMVDFG